MSADMSIVNHCSAWGQYSRPQSGALVKLTPNYIAGRMAIKPL